MKTEYSNEKWAYLKQFKGYQISNYGRIKNMRSSKIGYGTINASGYTIYRFYIYKADGSKKIKDHRIDQLVSQYFLEEPVDKLNYILSHKDHDLANNHLTNLCWEPKPSRKSFKKPICEYDLEGKYIRSWKSASAIASVYPIAARTIHDACVSRIKTAYGRQWRYYEDSSQKKINKVQLRPSDRLKLDQKIRYHLYRYDQVIDPTLLYESTSPVTYSEELSTLIQTASLNNEQKNTLRKTQGYLCDLEALIKKLEIKNGETLDPKEKEIIEQLTKQ